MTSREVAERLNIPPRTLDQWAYLGKGPAFVKVGRHRRYLEADVLEYINANRTSTSNLS